METLFACRARVSCPVLRPLVLWTTRRAVRKRDQGGGRDGPSRSTLESPRRRASQAAPAGGRPSTGCPRLRLRRDRAPGERRRRSRSELPRPVRAAPRLSVRSSHSGAAVGARQHPQCRAGKPHHARRLGPLSTHVPDDDVPTARTRGIGVIEVSLLPRRPPRPGNSEQPGPTMGTSGNRRGNRPC
jgi:hypothetical protein